MTFQESINYFPMRAKAYEPTFDLIFICENKKVNDCPVSVGVVYGKHDYSSAITGFIH